MSKSYSFFLVAFRMYDLDGDEKISKEELLAVLTMMVGANISEEQLMSIAERTIHEADEDKDTLISFDVSKYLKSTYTRSFCFISNKYIIKKTSLAVAYKTECV